MLSVVKQMFSLLNRKEKRQAGWIFMLVLIMGIAEVVGIASIMPFLAVIADSSVIDRSEKLSYLYNTFHFESKSAFLTALGIGVLLTLVFVNTAAAITQRSLSWFTNMIAHTLSHRLLIHYLSQPYVFFLRNHSASMAQNILSEVNAIVRNILVSIMQSGARLIVCLLIFILLIVVNPPLTIIALGTLGGAYSIVYLVVRKKLNKIGKKRLESTISRHKAITEIFTGIKDLKVKGHEEIYIKKYDNQSIMWARYQAIHENISMIPRYVIETFAFGGIIIIVLYLMIYQQGLSQALPTIGLFAFAGQRMMPGMQNIFMNATKIRFSKAGLEQLIEEVGDSVKADDIKIVSDHRKLSMREHLQIKDVFFSYTPEQNVLNGLNLTIDANTTIGFVGGTGAGKSTLIDIILGLLQTNKGQVLVDGTPLSPNTIRAWQNTIGYVSQNIVLFDDSVAANISCGLPEDQINMAAVKTAAALAKIDHFIENELPKSYETHIGENGVRLSGGQRQRLGIARALYANPSLIIFDEATSALDNITEQAVIDAISSLSHKKTILMIAHRLSTIKHCDLIHVLERGQIVASGTYDSLLKTSPEFQRLAMTEVLKPEKEELII
jgi:ABC-type multidrug transport system fused ATPase/permease subunit